MRYLIRSDTTNCRTNYELSFSRCVTQFLNDTDCLDLRDVDSGNCSHSTLVANTDKLFTLRLMGGQAAM